MTSDIYEYNSEDIFSVRPPIRNLKTYTGALSSIITVFAQMGHRTKGRIGYIGIPQVTEHIKMKEDAASGRVRRILAKLCPFFLKGLYCQWIASWKISKFHCSYFELFCWKGETQSTLRSGPLVSGRRSYCFRMNYGCFPFFIWRVIYIYIYMSTTLKTYFQSVPPFGTLEKTKFRDIKMRPAILLLYDVMFCPVFN